MITENDTSILANDAITLENYTLIPNKDAVSPENNVIIMYETHDV